MKIGILGTGGVGQTLGSKLIELGHEVMMGSRSSNHEKAIEWVNLSGKTAYHGNFSDASAFGEILFNCTKGDASIEALGTCGNKNLYGKILIDVSNPLDFSKGMPPTLSTCNTSSIGEEIQNKFPEIKVVKSLNTMWSGLMVNPMLIGNGGHTVFLSGNDESAKEEVKKILNQFGWKDDFILDLGDISTSRGVEMYLPLWLRTWSATGSAAFNIRIVS